MNLSDLHIDSERLAALCRRYHVASIEVLGSFARGDAGPESDVDLLVTFQHGFSRGLEIVAFKDDLEGLLGRKVDLLSKASVQRSPNKYFRRYTLRDARRLYDAS